MSSFLSLDMSLNNCAVTLEFEWYGEEPNWETFKVIALLPSYGVVEGKQWVLVNDLLSDNDWDKVWVHINMNEDKLKLQEQANEY